jgi:RimJ/RimL family protein N-acetyltransferase
MDESQPVLHYRMRSDDRLIGFVACTDRMGNGAYRIRHWRSRIAGAYGSEGLRLMLRYAFAELNLHRLTAITGSYNLGALHMMQKAGFVEEVRRRQALYRDGQRWDILHLGLLRSEWQPQEVK